MGGEKLRLTTKMFLDTVICRPTCNTLDVSQLLVGAGLNEKSAIKPIAQVKVKISENLGLLMLKGC